MEKVATVLIARPTDPGEETEEMIVYMLEHMGLDPLDPTLQVEYLETRELPPIELPVHEVDQLMAHARDASDEAVFFTVLVETKLDA